MSGSFTVGYHAPPPEAHTGVADYAWQLFKEMQRHGEVVADAEEASIHLYHVGNNSLHDEIYARALATPGVALLHDAVLHHFLLGRFSEERYLEEWVHNYGEWRRDFGRDLWRNRAGSSTDLRYFQYPMLRRIVERSRLVLVHNPGAAAMAKAHGAEDVHVVPHFFESGPLPDTPSVFQFRQTLGVEPGATLFGIFGYLREPKRIIPCLRAFRRLHAVRPDTAMLISGECVSRELDRLLGIETAHHAIHRLPHLPAAKFQLAAASIDCCLNLRYPAAGETSGIAVRMMGYGKPVIVTESLENSSYPAGSCLRVTPGVAEEEELFDYMGLVTEFPRTAREIGAEAACYIRARHSLPLVARSIWEVLCSGTSAAS